MRKLIYIDQECYTEDHKIEGRSIHSEQYAVVKETLNEKFNGREYEKKYEEGLGYKIIQDINNRVLTSGVELGKKPDIQAERDKNNNVIYADNPASSNYVPPISEKEKSQIKVDPSTGEEYIFQPATEEEKQAQREQIEKEQNQGKNGTDAATMQKEWQSGHDKGFADGIENNRYLAVDAGTNLGNDAYNAAKRAIDAHSPSKKAHKLGNFFGLGFVNGIHEYTSDAYGESYSMADEARKGLSNAISKVNDILNDGRTNQPTIRPVLDLTDIESGAGRINGLFKNVNVGGNLNAITVGMRSKGQNGTANDVVSAINKLGSNIGSGGDTYNINGITYDDQSSISEAVQILIRAANIERRS